METRSWTYGQCDAAVHAHGVAVLPPGHGPTVHRMWELLDQGASFTRCVQLLTAEFGSDLDQVPDFVLMVGEDNGIRVAVRGSFILNVRSDQQVVSIDGDSLVTWTEHRFPSIDAWSVALGRNVEELPEADGIVRDAVLKVDTLWCGTLYEAPAAEEDDEAAGDPDGAHDEAPTSASHDEPGETGEHDEAGEAGEDHEPSEPDEVGEAGDQSDAGDTGEHTPSDADTAPEDSDDLATEAFDDAGTDNVEENGDSQDPSADEPSAEEAGTEESGADEPSAEDAPECPSSSEHTSGDDAPSDEAARGEQSANLTSEGTETEDAETDEVEAEDTEAEGSAEAESDRPDLSPDLVAELAADLSPELAAKLEAGLAAELAAKNTPAPAKPHNPTQEATDASLAEESPAGNALAATEAPEASSSDRVSEETLHEGMLSDHTIEYRPGAEDAHHGEDSHDGDASHDAAPANTDGEHPAQAAPLYGTMYDQPEFHDGHTINLAALAHTTKAKVAISTPDSEDNSPDEGRKVLAVPCVADHPNPPYLQSCRVCGQEMSRTLIHVDRPSLGRLILSSGEVIELDRDIVFGRNPKDLHRAGRSNVCVVTIESEENDISRTHCEIRVDGWDARVRDLGSQNGTFITHVGQSSRRVEQSRPEILRCGDIITLAESISIRLEC